VTVGFDAKARCRVRVPNHQIFSPTGNRLKVWSRRVSQRFAATGVFVLLVIVLGAEEFGHQKAGPEARADVAPIVQPVLAQASTIQFNRDIRPILSDRCFSCHGPDTAKRQSGLRLDQRVAAFAQLPNHKSKRAFVPGDLQNSYAYQRMISTDPTEVMPPATSHLKLNSHETDLIRRWILQGAHWQEHWAFVKPVRPDLPAVKDASWCKNEIDRFVLAKLEEQGLHPSQPADKATLIRRVSLDLTGIPPTPAQLDAFLADSSPNAYEKVVDRLLASPHYGEQMAVQWLDYSRYADSHGFQSDPERHMSAWRDWVINAYNKNMPFDEFAIEQLAGDLLPHPTMDQIVATGFNRNDRHNSEGGIIAEEWRIESVIDRTSTTSAVFLGLTMECCRCHDHKFDPITQKEFYQFSAYFNSVDEVSGDRDRENVDSGINAKPILKLATPEQQSRLDQLEAEMQAADKSRDELKKSLSARELAWEQAGAKAVTPAGLLAAFPLDGVLDGHDASGKALAVSLESGSTPTFVDGPAGKSLSINAKTGTINLGDAFNVGQNEPCSFGAWVRLRGGGAIFSRTDSDIGSAGFEVFSDNDRIAVRLIHEVPDNLVSVRTADVAPMDRWFHLMVTYDGSSKASGIKIYLDGRPAFVEPRQDSLNGSTATNAPLRIGKSLGATRFDGDVSDICFYGRALKQREIAAIISRPALPAILKTPPAKRTEKQKQKLYSFVELADPAMMQADNHADEATIAFADLDKRIPDTQIMKDLPKPRETHILIRGQYDHPGEKVEPGTPAILPPLPPNAPKNRLGLARWIVDPANPLTSRVLVNRLWEKFFGIGLEKTSENFGTQCDWPSHPELLDWLATEIVRLHWDMKALQKEIVMSAAYQQDSTLTPEIIERDPENRLISHGPRFRLMAETIRDQALAVSGLLSDKIGGPSVRPYEPLNLWDGNLFGNLAKYVPDKGEGLYRRSIYTFIKRTATPPNLTLFDMPSREYCVIRRSRTDTPLQALDLLNDPTYVEASRVLAQKMMIDGGSTPQDRIIYGFRTATCRPPTEEEVRILLAGFDRQLQNFKEAPDDAAKLLAIGATPVDRTLDRCELAAYTMTARVVLNLDEMITRQ
jgi:hypothetical protein